MDINHIENLLSSIFIQLIIILSVAQLFGYLAQKIGQPRVVGEIVAGLMLGPSFFGFLEPNFSASIFQPDTSVVMHVLSQIGLILLMFQIGSDFKFSHLIQRKNRQSVLRVSFVSLAVPLMVGFAVGWFSQPYLALHIDRLSYSLFVSISFSITAVPILGRILREFRLNQSELGVIAISSAAINDVIGWVLLAAVSAVTSSKFDIYYIGIQLLGISIFISFLWFIGSHLIEKFLLLFPSEKYDIPSSLICTVLISIFLCGIITQKLGIFTIFGGFALGILFYNHETFTYAWEKTIGRFVFIFFLPIFFTYTGLRTNIFGLTTQIEWTWCALIFAGANLAKIVPVYFAGRISNFSRSESGILGTLMNTRALMELIVLNIGFSLGFIPQNVFTMLVLMAIGTTIITGPALFILLNAEGVKILRLKEA